MLPDVYTCYAVSYPSKSSRLRGYSSTHDAHGFDLQPERIRILSQIDPPSRESSEGV